MSTHTHTNKHTLGFGAIKVLRYTTVFRNPEGLIFNLHINICTLFFMLKVTDCVNVMYCSAQHGHQKGGQSVMIERQLEEQAGKMK